MSHMSKAGLERVRQSKMADRNPMWKGDHVQYTQLHAWVKARLPKPDLCEECKAVPPYDLTNDGTYDRDLKHWRWLCRRCHMAGDGRLADFISHTNAGKRGRANANYRHSRRVKEAR